ncbi:LysR family transcriptional regulator [Streptomyces xanthochromogenes]|uniref:LysR family transcriptional regulator n=1 Tax=Streptomyces xanthochromogenes TaxID=67384 RepID=UPI0034454CA4
MRISHRVPDLSALDLLLSVIELGSQGRAAQAHGISQPSVSSRIRYLEQLVGAPVLRRTSLGSVPTAAGEMVAALAREVLDAAQRLDAKITRIQDDRDGHVQVSASQTIVEYLLPGWLNELRTRSPRTALTLDACNSRDAATAVATGGADLAFVEGPTLPPELESATVARDELLVVAPPQHPWAQRTAITIEELGAGTLLHREAGSGARTAFEKAMQQHLPDWRPDPLIELSSTPAIKNAVASGLAPAVLSSLAVKRELMNGSLTVVDVSGLRMRRSLLAVWPTGQRLTGPARQLCAIAVKSRPAR